MDYAERTDRLMYDDVEEMERVFFTEHLGVRVFETVWSDGQYEYEYYNGVMGVPVPSLGGTHYHERQDEERVHELIEEWVNG